MNLTDVKPMSNDRAVVIFAHIVSSYFILYRSDEYIYCRLRIMYLVCRLYNYSILHHVGSRNELLIGQVRIP